MKKNIIGNKNIGIKETTQFICSPTDLAGFIKCTHSTFLNIELLNSKIDYPTQNNTNSLISDKGIEHESEYLLELQKTKDVTCIEEEGSMSDRAEATLEAMARGDEVIYQGVLLQKNDDEEVVWQGIADFLIKTDKQKSKFGSFSYEVLDVKLSKIAKAEQILQLCVYSDLLVLVQGCLPKNFYLFLGDKEKYSYKLQDYFYYYKQVKKEMAKYILDIGLNEEKKQNENNATPCNACSFCKWDSKCKQEWLDNMDLCLVANLSKNQRLKLHKSNVKTISDLANLECDERVEGISRETLNRLKIQANLQHKKMLTGKNFFEIKKRKEVYESLETINEDIDEVVLRGFARIPEANKGDLFFDMEGFPLYQDGGLEYLFGVYYFDDIKQEYTFLPFWAHNHEQEKQAFIEFMKFIYAHLQKNPSAYIYHYNHYETTALKRLSGRYGACEDMLDNILRANKFVDLYVVVKESIYISEPKYSIKNLEVFYMDKREDEVSNAMDSLVEYDRYLQDGDEKILESIREYNMVDCVSTLKLRDWLLGIKEDSGIQYEDDEKIKNINLNNIEKKDWELEFENYKKKLENKKGYGQVAKNHFIDLLEFHKREEKPQWWNLFSKRDKNMEELVEDAECLADLELVGFRKDDKGVNIYTYSFAEQDTKMKIGDVVNEVFSIKRAGTIVGMDEEACKVEIKTTKTKELPQTLVLAPGTPVPSEILRKSVYKYVDKFLNTNDEDDSLAVVEMLEENYPKIKGKKAGSAIISKVSLEETIDSVTGLDNSYMVIQGPPGAGKTYTSSNIIVELIRQGKKVGVSSNSHKAVHNLLNGIVSIANQKRVKFFGCKKCTKGKEDTYFHNINFENIENAKHTNINADLFAGTAWYFANNSLDGALDFLFIDEAGQVSLANITAMANSTKNIVLVGDQMQLSQPIQGSHPNKSGSSALEFLLEGRQTIDENMGIFLANTYRMREGVCGFISNSFYDGLLKSDKSTANIEIDLKNNRLPNEGLVIVEANYKNCVQKNTQEAELIRKLYADILGKGIKVKGVKRAIVADDILVVSPYNMQVLHLSSVLPEGARVGTVDKFQGQEAAVVLISMTSSDGKEVSRGIEFLYSKNRLNVAVSRAKCLSIVVMSPMLLQVDCDNIKTLELVNTFCYLNDSALKLNGYQ